MKRAARLLADRNLGVKEIAFTLGYPSDSQLIRDFHLALGTTPDRWRKAAPRPNEGQNLRGGYRAAEAKKLSAPSTPEPDGV